MMSIMDREEILQLRIRMLTEGAMLREGLSTVRKGGAGPVGGRYFVLPDGNNCGIPIRDSTMASRFSSTTLEPTKEEGSWIYDSSTKLAEVPTPSFYNLQTENGIPYYKLALLHGSSCLATTVYQSCRYWSTHTQCKYCTIPLSYLSHKTTLEKTPAQIAEVVKAAEAEGIIDNILMTTGTPESPDMGINLLAGITRSIREVSSLPIAVQFEPPHDITLIDQLADAGVDAVGIHLESADESIRESICPGKFTHGSIELYYAAWERSLEFFKRGDVSTFILYGLGESLEKTLRLCEDVARMGVMPIVTPFRPALGSQLADFVPSYVGAFEETLEFYKSLGHILATNGLNPRNSVGGCSRCGGCTPIQAAYDWAMEQ